MIGMGAIVRSTLRGATVIAVDLDDEKLELAKRVGAHHTINSMTENVHERLTKITEGFGPDVVIELSAALQPMSWQSMKLDLPEGSYA